MPNSASAGPHAPLIAVRVLRAHMDCTRVKLLELAPLGLDPLPAAEAGAHIDIVLPSGLTRQYSLILGRPAGKTNPGSYRIAVKLEASGRGGSRAIHADLAAGMTLSIGVPRNSFPLDRR